MEGCQQCRNRQNTSTNGDLIYFNRAQNVNIHFTTDQEKVEEDTFTEVNNYRNLADAIQVKVYNAANSVPSKACLDECKVLITYGLRRQDYAIRFAIYEGQADTMRTSEHLAEDLYDHPVYKCMKLLAPHTSFPRIALMIYRFRYAGANAVSGRVHEAKMEAEKGMQILKAFLNKKSMARDNASCLYGYINVQLAELALRPKTGQKETILEWIEKGLEQVKVITESEVANMWARMFLVKKALHLLRIGLSGEDVSDVKDISPADRETAQQCLWEADVHWTNTDKRRHMLYKRAEAKLHLLGDKTAAARASLKEAITLAHDFKREEKTFKQILQKWIT